MVKTIKSLKSVQALALRSGAKITRESGAVFNSEKKKIAKAPSLPSDTIKKQAPVAIPSPVQAPDNSEALKATIDSIAQSATRQEIIAEKMASAIREFTATQTIPVNITDIDIIIVRGEDNLMDRLKIVSRIGVV